MLDTGIKKYKQGSRPVPEDFKNMFVEHEDYINELETLTDEDIERLRALIGKVEVKIEKLIQKDVLLDSIDKLLNDRDSALTKEDLKLTQLLGVLAQRIEKLENKKGFWQRVKCWWKNFLGIK